MSSGRPAEYLANISTAKDRKRFLEAARGILADDPDLKQFPSRTRSKLVRGSIDTAPDPARLIDESWRAAGRRK